MISAADLWRTGLCVRNAKGYGWAEFIAHVEPDAGGSGDFLKREFGMKVANTAEEYIRLGAFSCGQQFVHDSVSWEEARREERGVPVRLSGDAIAEFEKSIWLFASELR
jgi:hypothetical protein